MLFHTAAVSHYLDLYFTGEVGKLNKPGYLGYLEATFTTSNGSFLITLNIEHWTAGEYGWEEYSSQCFLILSQHQSAKSSSLNDSVELFEINIEF